MDKTEWAADESTRRSSAARFVSWLVEVIKRSTIKRHLIIVLGKAAERFGNVPDTKTLLVLVAAGYMVKEWVPRSMGVDFKKTQSVSR